VEIYKGPSHRRFWEDPAAQRARGIAQAAVQALWPDAYRAATRFPLALPNPLDPVGGQAAPQEGSAEWNRTVADAEALYRQPGRVWAAIHVLVHNAHDPLRPAQALASRSLAAWLRQHFMCCNCRGFWAVDVLNAVGLPPEAAEREAHKVRSAQWFRIYLLTQRAPLIRLPSMSSRCAAVVVEGAQYGLGALRGHPRRPPLALARGHRRRDGSPVWALQRPHPLPKPLVSAVRGSGADVDDTGAGRGPTGKGQRGALTCAVAGNEQDRLVCIVFLDLVHVFFGVAVHSFYLGSNTARRRSGAASAGKQTNKRAGRWGASAAPLAKVGSNFISMRS
jgi:hypothetical protein